MQQRTNFPPPNRAVRARLELLVQDNRAQFYMNTIGKTDNIPVTVLLISNDGTNYSLNGMVLDPSRLKVWEINNLAAAFACQMSVDLSVATHMIFRGCINIGEDGTKVTYNVGNHPVAMAYPPLKSQLLYKGKYYNWQFFENC